LSTGPKLKAGIEAAFDETGWQVAGKKIEFLVGDSVSNPASSMDKIRKMVERDKVDMMLGINASHVMASVMPYLEEHRVPTIKVLQFPGLLKKKFRYLFLPGGTLQQVTYFMGDFAYDELGYRKITLMGADFIAGHIFANAFMNQFKKRGGAIIQQQWFPPPNMDFSSYLVNLKEADACFVWSGLPAGVRLVQQYADYGLLKKMPLMGYYMSGIFDESVLKDEGIGCLGVCGPASYASTIDDPLNKKFVEAFKKKYGTRPSSLNYGGYQCALTAIEAIKATGGDTSHEKLRDAILNLEIQTPTGPLRFTTDGIGISNKYIVKNVKENGEYLWQVVRTYENVTPPPPGAPPKK
jgi:branched-chain amino acid transport system substrate-binding protein